MAALHEALKTLGIINYSNAPTDDLKSFLENAFQNSQLIVDSIPISNNVDSASSRSRSNTTSSVASSASEIAISDARSSPPPSEVEALHKEWKQVKLKPTENPLGISVYQTKGKDGKGTWFARRSVHEGLGFTKWKRGLEREFPETLKVQGGPGEGNIRGIGGEKRIAYNHVDGVGKMEVYLLSAQFPGPTTPRDFLTMLISSDQALKEQNNEEVPRHYMVISKPCQHPDAPPREGYIRGQYESVEFIREIPIKKAPPKSTSTSNIAGQTLPRNRSESNLGREAVLRNALRNHDSLNTEGEGATHEQASRSDSNLAQTGGRSRAKTVGAKPDIPSEYDESEQNPIEWIMVTRSDPGGSVPRFMVDRGTPGAIVGDAGKFLDWACSKTIEDLESDDEELIAKGATTEEGTDGLQLEHSHHKHDHERDLHNYQTNGHLAGIESQLENPTPTQVEVAQGDGGIYGMVTSAAGALLAAHAPATIADRMPQQSESPSIPETTRMRSQSLSSNTSESTIDSFTSALSFTRPSTHNTFGGGDSAADQNFSTQQDKELQKLEEKKRKLNEKLEKARQKEADKKTEDGEREKEALRKLEEKHEREVKRQHEKYQKEVEKLEKKREKEELKRKKREEKEKGENGTRENETLKAELEVLKREKEILRTQVGTVQRENTLLVGKIGKLGFPGEEMLREVREELAGNLKGRKRAGSTKSGRSGRTSSPHGGSSGSGEIERVP